MSDNIHGMSSPENEDNNRDENDSTPLLLRIRYRGNAKNQTICNYFKETICPLFTFKSFSFIIIIINIVIYIISLIPHGLNKRKIEFSFLPPSSQTLNDMGALYGPKIRESFIQAYRWIMGNLLHADFTHIFFNCFSILIVGTWLEYLIGVWRYLVIYVLSGILGSLFSVLVAPHISSVGASICICGVIAAYLSYYLINWHAIPRIFGVQNRCTLLCIPILLVILCLPIYYNSEGSGFDDTTINIYGHLGGIIFGFFLGFIFIKPKNDNDPIFFPFIVYFITGIICCSVFAVVGYLCFYLMDKYKY